MNVQQAKVGLTVHDESILVVKRSVLFSRGSWQGLKQINIEDFSRLVYLEKEFHPRYLMETDVRYKQIIPYLIFTHNNSYFLMQRQSTAGEQRLKNKYSLGIGGHIRKEDLVSGDIMKWAQREFNEEVSYNGSYSISSLGLLNDDSSPVGEVHLGCVLLLTGNSSQISIKSELKSGQLLTLEECESFRPQMESWSQTVFDTLKALQTRHVG